MRVVRVTADLGVTSLDGEPDFWRGFLGLDHEEMGLDWVTRYVVPTSGEHVQLVTEDASAPETPVLTVKVDDVDAFHAEAVSRGYEVVHPLTTEAWGIRRFFVRTPGGAVLNIAQHHE